MAQVLAQLPRLAKREAPPFVGKGCSPQIRQRALLVAVRIEPAARILPLSVKEVEKHAVRYIEIICEDKDLRPEGPLRGHAALRI